MGGRPSPVRTDPLLIYFGSRYWVARADDQPALEAMAKRRRERGRGAVLVLVATIVVGLMLPESAVVLPVMIGVLLAFGMWVTRPPATTTEGRREVDSATVAEYDALYARDPSVRLEALDLLWRMAERKDPAAAPSSEDGRGGRIVEATDDWRALRERVLGAATD